MDEEKVDDLPLILSGNKFFKVTSTEGDKVKAQCLVCEANHNRIAIISGFLKATTNFRTHLKRLHPDAVHNLEKWKAEMKIQGKRLRSSGEQHRHPPLKQLKLYDIKRQIITENSSLQKRLDHNIYNYIVCSMRPLSTVEDLHFIKIIKDLNDGIEVISRRTIGRKINTNYNKFKSDLRERLKSVKYVCTTADIWSTKHRSFMGITAHWINEMTLERQSAVLSCRRFKGTHSYERVADILLDIHGEYGLKNGQIVSTITDNGSNFVKAFKEFGISLEKAFDNNMSSTSHTNSISEEDDDTETSNDLSFMEISHDPFNPAKEINDSPERDYLAWHLRCASHTLSLLATTDFTNALKKSCTTSRIHHSTFAKCSALWNASRRPKTSEIISEILQCTLKFPCPTRWNSLFDSVSQLLQFKNKLHIVTAKLELPQLKEIELEYLEEYSTVLKPITVALNLMQNEKTCFYGELLPTLVSLKNRLCMLLEINLRHLSNVVTLLINSLTERFKIFLDLAPQANDAILAACFHPAFKLRWFPNTASENDRKRIYKLCVNSLEQFSSTSTESSEDEASENDSNFFIFSSANEADCSRQREKQLSTVECELAQFFNDKGKTIDILSKYAVVKEAFVRYNTSLCSSAPVERLFSFAGFINSPSRGAISDELFEELIVLKGNMNYCTDYF